MSLTQHGSQTAKNSTINIPNSRVVVISAWVFISMCADDAQVLNRT